MKRAKTALILALLSGTANAAPCLNWAAPTLRVDGTPLRPELIAGYRINWARIGSNLKGQTALITGTTYCFNANKRNRYTFEAITVLKDGTVSEPGNQIRWGAW